MSAASDEITVISSDQGMKGFWRDFWKYRELLTFLVWRDLAVRYKQTAIGVAWSVLRPVTTMLIFTFVFGKVAKLPSGGVPYPVLVFAALIPWQFFATALSESGNSLVGSAHLLSKIYFPRLLIPSGAVIVTLVDFAISLALLAILMVIYQVPLTWRVLTLPLFSVLVLLTASSFGLLIATVMVKYRDFRFILPFIVQFGFFISPVGYTSEVVPEQWRLLYSLNPLVPIIEGFRWALLGGTHQVQWEMLAFATVLVLSIGWVALRYFRATERGMADII